jgi:DNA modification methylase
VTAQSRKPTKLLMDGAKANLVITDPPYNVNYEGSAGKIKNDNMASEKFFDFLLRCLLQCMEKVMADDASIYVFHADTEGLNFRRAFDAAGFYLSGCCIWKKQSWCWAAPRISGSTSLCCTDGRRAASISGTPGGSRPPSGSSRSPRRTVTIRP